MKIKETGASRPLLDILAAIKAALQRDNVTQEQARRLLAYWDVLQAKGRAGNEQPHCHKR